MIQNTIMSNFTCYINTKANQITPQSEMFPFSRIRFLVKFTNDMSGKTIFVYPIEQIENRSTRMDFYNNPNPNMFIGELDLKLAGYWKYEIYEVYWEKDPVSFNNKNTPRYPKEILIPNPQNGIVKGMVAIGKMYSAEQPTKEEVQYTEYDQPKKPNYVYNGI